MRLVGFRASRPPHIRGDDAPSVVWDAVLPDRIYGQVAIDYVLDRSLGVFSLKALAASAFAAISIAVLRITVSTPNTGVGDFIYLCALCGAGSLIFAGTLAAFGAVHVPRILALWHNTEET